MFTFLLLTCIVYWISLLPFILHSRISITAAFLTALYEKIFSDYTYHGIMISVNDVTGTSRPSSSERDCLYLFFKFNHNLTILQGIISYLNFSIKIFFDWRFFLGKKIFNMKESTRFFTLCFSQRFHKRHWKHLYY